MANEAEILVTNEQKNGWVDHVPGKISSGYQAQNVAIQAHSMGQDLSHVTVQGDSVVVAVSGPIDDTGIPYVVKAPVTLRPQRDGTYYIVLVPGSVNLRRTLILLQIVPVFDPIKMGLYSNGRRVLNWVVTRAGGVTRVARMLWAPGESAVIPGGIGGDLSIKGALTAASSAEVKGALTVGGKLTIGADLDFGFDIIPGTIILHDSGSDEILSSDGRYYSELPYTIVADGTYRITVNISTSKRSGSRGSYWIGTTNVKILKNGNDYGILRSYSKGNFTFHEDIPLVIGDRIQVSSSITNASSYYAAQRFTVGYGNILSKAVKILLGLPV